MRPLSIRVLAGRLDRGAGSRVYHHELAKRLAGRGHSVSVIGFESTHTLPDSVRVLQFGAPDYSKSRFLWRVATLAKYRYCYNALSALNLSRPDVVIGGEHLWLASHRKMFSSTPWIYLPHSLTVRDEIQNYGLCGLQHSSTLFLYQRLQRWAMRNASCVLRFTRAGCDALRAEYPAANTSPFYVNEIGIDIPTLAPVHMRGHRVKLLIVGQLAYRKGIDIALNALSTLAQRPWELTIVGEGPLRKELEEQAVRCGIGDRVRFVGPSNNPSEWYRASDLLLFPSRSESLGLVALESMAHGTPCIAFKASSQFRTVSEEFIDSNTTGWLADDPEDFTRRLSTLIAQPSIIHAAGQRASAVIARRYSWTSHLQRYEELFERMIASVDDHR